MEKAYRNWSVVQAVLGLAVVGLGVAAIRMDSKFSGTAVPLWSGAWFIMTGFLGISAAQNSINSCMVGSHLVFCIVGIMYAINMTVLFATASSEEQENDSGASIAARAAVDICITITGMFQVILSLRCMMYACRLCGADDFLSRSDAAGAGNSREIEVTARPTDIEEPQTPSVNMEPPSYAYINSLAQQSIRFASGDYPSVPSHADQPPSYSEVTAGSNAWTPTSMQIQISYAPPGAAEERQQERSVDGPAADSDEPGRRSPSAAVDTEQEEEPLTTKDDQDATAVNSRSDATDAQEQECLVDLDVAIDENELSLQGAYGEPVDTNVITQSEEIRV